MQNFDLTKRKRSYFAFKKWILGKVTQLLILQQGQTVPKPVEDSQLHQDQWCTNTSQPDVGCLLKIADLTYNLKYISVIALSCSARVLS